MLDLPYGPILVAAWLSAFAPLAGWLAARKDRSVGPWILFGAVLGPIAAVILLLAPPGRCPTCGQPVRGWLQSCTGCGTLFREAASSDGADEAAAGPAPASAPSASAAATGRAAVASERPVTLAERTRRARGGGIDRPATVETVDHLAATDAALQPHRSATELGRRPDEIPSPPIAIDAEPAPRSTRRRARPAAIQESAVEVAAPDADAAAPSPRKRATRATVTMLGSGVYIGGNRPLQPGSRYLVARVGPEFQAFGPVHLNPATLADRVALSEVEAVMVDRRLVVSSREGKSSISMVFQAIAVEPGVDLEVALRPRTRHAVGSS